MKELKEKAIWALLKFMKKKDGKITKVPISYLGTNKANTEFEISIKDRKRKLDTSTQRYEKLDTIIKNLYEDNIDGKLSDERFKKLSEDYEKDQNLLEKEIKDLKQFISKLKETRDNTNQFIELVNKYTNIKKLTPELLRNFIEKAMYHIKK